MEAHNLVSWEQLTSRSIGPVEMFASNTATRWNSSASAWWVTTTTTPWIRGHDHHQLAPAVTYTGGFAGSNFWIYPWLIAYMRYDFVNSPTRLC